MTRRSIVSFSTGTAGYQLDLEIESSFSAPIVFTTETKSLTLVTEISLNSLETSGRANAATAMAASGSTYKYFKRAHGLDFFLIIIVIRFLSEL